VSKSRWCQSLQADSGHWTEGSGVVIRLLPDDDDVARHQRFIIKQRDGRSVLIAHNIEIAQRVPVGMGDRVQFRGVYEWNDLGGLVHWTHHDPHGLEQGGFIRLGSRKFA